ncbi:response regulator [Clostridium sp. JNZ J1-5]
MKKVIVVDDTKNIRTLLTTCLEVEGYIVFNAKNAEEALNIIKQEDIDLAFIDVKMPGISGTELLKKVKELNIDILVVIMTAFPTVKNAVDCTKLGAVTYLQKPFTAERVKNLLKEIYESVEEKEKRDLNMYITSGKELLEKGDFEKALKALKKALEIEPTKGETYYLIGRVYEGKNLKNDANKFYSTAKTFGFKELI